MPNTPEEWGNIVADIDRMIADTKETDAGRKARDAGRKAGESWDNIVADIDRMIAGKEDSPPAPAPPSAPDQASDPGQAGTRSIHPLGGLLRGPYMQEPGFQEKVKGGRQALLQGLTAGFSDEIGAGASAVLNYLTDQSGRSLGDIYTSRLEQERRGLREFRESNPVLATVLEIAGAVPTAVASGPMAVAPAAVRANSVRNLLARAGGRAGRRTKSQQPLKRPAMARRIAQGAAGGAASGAVYGFGAGEDGFGNRAANAVLPGAFGAGVGAAAPLAGIPARYAGEAISRGRTARMGGVEGAAVDPLQEIMERDIVVHGNQFLPDERNLLANLGPQSRADFDTARGLLGDRANVGHRETREIAQRASSYLTETLDDTLGSPVGAATAEKAVKSNSALRPLYDKAYGTPIDYTSAAGDELMSIMMRRVPPSAIAAANKIMRLQGDRSKQLRVRLSDDGERIIGFEVLPDTRQLHYVLQALDSDIGRLAQEEGYGGTMRHAVKGLRRHLRDALGEANPAFAAVQSRAADDFASINAMRMGYEAMSPNVQRSVLREEIAGMSEPELKMVAQGMREAIDDAAARAKRSFVPNPTVSGHVSRRAQEDPETLKVLQNLSTRSSRDKVAMVIGDRKADELFDGIDSLSSAYQLEQTIAENLRSGARERLTRAETRHRESPLGLLQEARPLEATREAASRFFGKDPHVPANPDVPAAVYEALFKPSTPENIARMMTVHHRPKPVDAGRRAARLADLLASRGVTGAGLPLISHPGFPEGGAP